MLSHMTKSRPSYENEEEEEGEEGEGEEGESHFTGSSSAGSGGDAGAEMQALMNTIRQSINLARKSRARKERPASTVTKRVPGQRKRSAELAPKK